MDLLSQTEYWDKTADFFFYRLVGNFDEMQMYLFDLHISDLWGILTEV